tara:strand:+ start:1479 stop:2039 length:561 start_codon:yes stop_codon:yes gene_type:complete
MSKDLEKGLGELIGYETPETRARRVRAIAEKIKHANLVHTEPKSEMTNMFPLDLDTPLATPKETPKPTPKVKKERTDKIYRHSMMMKHITRPKVNKEAILDYIKWHNEKFPNDNTEPEEGASPEQMKGLEERLAQSRAMTGDPQPVGMGDYYKSNTTPNEKKKQNYMKEVRKNELIKKSNREGKHG